MKRLADYDATILALHEQGRCPQQIAAALDDHGVTAEPGAIYERIVWLTMPRAHSSA